MPAYNEGSRLPETLVTIDDYLATQEYESEIIVADDGSTDQTASIAEDFCADRTPLTVIRLPHRGKAATVRDGILAARGKYILFTDADLPTPMSYSSELLEALQSGADVAIGSREGHAAHRYNEPDYRHLMGRIFNAIVRVVAVPAIDDTQCGFKAFRHDAAQQIFHAVRLYADDREISGPSVTAFDVEVLFIARKFGYTIQEVPVAWSYVSGSKVNPALDSVRMVVDVLTVRWNDFRGKYEKNQRNQER